MDNSPNDAEAESDTHDTDANADASADADTDDTDANTDVKGDTYADVAKPLTSILTKRVWYC